MLSLEPVAKVKTMRGVFRILAVCALGVCFSATLGNFSHAATADAGAAHQLYDKLNSLRVDSSRVFAVRNLELRRPAFHLTLTEGRLAFLDPFQGKATGAVFSGRGHILLIPTEPAEKASIGRFLKAPLLDETINSAYLRFDDDTANELNAALQRDHADAHGDADFATEWNSVVATLNRWHSLRMMADALSARPIPYFYAEIGGDPSGPFDLLVDQRREESVLVGQSKTVEGRPVFDFWASFRPPNASTMPNLAFSGTAFSLDSTISPDLDLDGSASVTLRAGADGERVVPLALSTNLRVESVTLGDGQALEYFQTDPAKQTADAGDDALYVILPQPSRAGEPFQLRFTYHGRVISDDGNGVFYVGSRGDWYPHPADRNDFAPYDMHFRWPHQWQLVADGTKVSEKEAGDWREGQWRSDQPYRVVGFNLGVYRSETVDAGALHIDLFANPTLEQELLARFRSNQAADEIPYVGQYDQRAPLRPGNSLRPAPSPAAILKKLGGDLADASQFYERLSGPFPFSRLEVSQIPGVLGQGWPGLLYLPTFTFLAPDVQRSAGLSVATQQHFTDIVPYHELAHQWWGNLVGWRSYRDQWICEAVANYVALLYVDSRKPGDHPLSTWLERYRNDLLTKLPGSDRIVDEAGPLALGYRLDSSLDARGYVHVTYPKGTWVFQMMRMMLRDPHAADPDARFFAMLRSLVETHRELPLSTADLQHAVEKVMTPAMDLEGDHSMGWFFDEWTQSTGIPRYKATFTSSREGSGVVIKGVLHQDGVSKEFIAPVPIYAAQTGSKPQFLGVVVTDGPETSFRFRASFAPRRLSIDPEMTLLCQPQ